jgi:hypothetical protein
VRPDESMAREALVPKAFSRSRATSSSVGAPLSEGPVLVISGSDTPRFAPPGSGGGM